MRKADNLPLSCSVVTKYGYLNFLETSGHIGPVMGLIYVHIMEHIRVFNGKVLGKLQFGDTGKTPRE